MTTPGRLPAEQSWTSLSAKTVPRPPEPIPADAKFITARQYCDRLGGISFTTLARMLARDPAMPRPIYFANRIRFFELAAIETYERLCEARTRTRTDQQRSR